MRRIQSYVKQQFHHVSSGSAMLSDCYHASTAASKEPDPQTENATFGHPFHTSERELA